jgi:hypothetical protein
VLACVTAWYSANMGSSSPPDELAKKALNATPMLPEVSDPPPPPAAPAEPASTGLGDAPSMSQVKQKLRQAAGRAASDLRRASEAAVTSATPHLRDAATRGAAVVRERLAAVSAAAMPATQGADGSVQVRADQLPPRPAAVDHSGDSSTVKTPAEEPAQAAVVSSCESGTCTPPPLPAVPAVSLAEPAVMASTPEEPSPPVSSSGLSSAPPSCSAASSDEEVDQGQPRGGGDSPEP